MYIKCVDCEVELGYVCCGSGCSGCVMNIIRCDTCEQIHEVVK